MSVWLPPRPEGTKNHREPSTQRGTDMAFSLSIPTVSTPHAKHSVCCSASRLGVNSQIHLMERDCANAAVWGQILYSSYRKRGAHPSPAPELRQMETASIRHISQILGNVLKAQISSTAVHGSCQCAGCQDVELPWGRAEEQTSKGCKRTHQTCSSSLLLILYPRIKTHLCSLMFSVNLC